MVNMSAWNVTPSRGKPGGQGSLFQVGDKDSVLNPAQRWPKGFTPERQREVGEALGSPSSPKIKVADTRPGEPTEFGGTAGRPGGNSRFHAWVRSEVARSTVPVEHLEGLRRITTSPDPDHHGTYWPRKQELGVTPGQGDTLIHELGHHHVMEHTLDAQREIPKAAEPHAWRDKSKYRDRPTRTDQALAENKVQAGVHEALADNYMVEHYRTPGRNPQRVTQGAYESNPNFQGENLEKHYPGYRDVRPGKNLGPQFSQEHLF